MYSSKQTTYSQNNLKIFIFNCDEYLSILNIEQCLIKKIKINNS